MNAARYGTRKATKRYSKGVAHRVWTLSCSQNIHTATLMAPVRATEIRWSGIIHGFHSLLCPTSRGSERNAADNFSFLPNQDSESLPPPRRRDCLSVLIDVPVLNGVSEEDKAGYTTIYEADAEAAESRVSCIPMVRCLWPPTHNIT